MKIALAVLWVAVASLCAQTIENVVVKLVESGGGAVWEISGTAPGLPSNTLLISQLKYQGRLVGDRARRLALYKERFQSRYDFSSKRVLSGEYAVIISYRPDSQPNPAEHAKFAPLVVEKKFYHAGGPGKDTVASDPPQDFYYRAIRESRLAEREYLAFLQKMFADIDTYMQELKDRTQTYLDETSGDKTSEVEAWIGPERKDGMHQRYLALQKEYDQKVALALAHCVQIETVSDLYKSMKLAEQMWRSCLYRLSRKYNFAVLQRYRWTDNGMNFTACCDSYMNEIRRHGAAVLQREPYPENLGLIDVEKDLLWFNSIYRDLAMAYQGQEGMFEAGKWQVSFDGAKAELSAWHERIGDYEKSPLAKNAEIMALLQQLEKNGQELANVYDAILNKTAGPGQVQKWENGLREAFAALTAIIDKTREEARTAKEKIAAEAGQLAAEFFEVEGELYRFRQENRRLTPEQRKNNFDKWYPEYKTRLAAIKKKFEKSPVVSQSREVGRLANSLRQLQNFVLLYKQTMARDKDSLGMRYLEFHQEMLDLRQNMDRLGATRQED